jgi:phage shock protein C
MSEVRKLTRSESERMLAGVCGGLAEYFSVDPTLVRVVFVLLTVFGGGGLIVYVAMWLLVPPASEAATGSGGGPDTEPPAWPPPSDPDQPAP